MTCINLPRISARLWTRKVDPAKEAWISIHEPYPDGTKVDNPELDKLPNLKLAFWDIVEPTIDIITKEECLPLTKEQAVQIVDFIMNHAGKDFYVNCAAGKSRSGAICLFLQNYFSYSWDEDAKKLARPNKLLYDLMVESYNKL